jgi:Short C-terminal domain
MGFLGRDTSDWLDAQATVLSEDPKGGSSGDTKHGRYYWKKNELQLRLALPDGTTETVGWKGNVPQSLCWSMTGRQLPCKVQPAKHDKVEFDWDAIVGWHQLRDASGRPLGAEEPPAGAAMLTGDAALAELERRGVHVQTTGAGVRIEHGAATSTDPLDRLEKLARLRDEGVVTQAEFEEQKGRLLGES